MSTGIWWEVSRVRIEGGKVDVQVKHDQDDDEPSKWRRVQPGALDESDGRPVFNAIAKGLDSSDQEVIAKLNGSDDGKGALVCSAIRIQTK